MLKQAVLTVKGVPMLYVPVLYYPTKKEDRATGFLIPTYGASTLRGQQLLDQQPAGPEQHLPPRPHQFLPHRAQQMRLSRSRRPEYEHILPPPHERPLQQAPRLLKHLGRKPPQVQRRPTLRRRPQR